MNRGKQLRKNTIVGLLSQLVTLICGFVVPRLILESYGSEVNGLVSSIAHFLSFISLAECGMGVVVQSSLYKPLAEGNNREISGVILSADRFFGKIGMLLAAYVGVLMIAYPVLVETVFDGLYTAALIGAISVSTFVQHYLCMSYRLLLTADQKGYIQLLIGIVTQIVNTILCVLLTGAGCPIQVLKLSTSAVMLLQPVFLTLYVKKHYSIDKNVHIAGDPIRQKWNGIAQHIAYAVLENTPTVVLTIFSTIANVSVYQVYYLVVSGIKGLIVSAVSGMQSLLGDMYAREETDALTLAFSYYEWVIHVTVVFLYTCTAALIVPFVRVYTAGITDTDYALPLFGLLISMAQMLFCLRLPYNAMIFAAGHYKQTQASALLEAAINITVSVLLVFRFGLVGVAAGTLAALAYKTIYLVCYLRKNILMRPVGEFTKHLLIDMAVICVSLLAVAGMEMREISYLAWVQLAVKTAAAVGAVVVPVNVIMYWNLLKEPLRRIRKNGSGR